MQLKIEIRLAEPCTLPLAYHHIVQSALYKLMAGPDGEGSACHNGGVYYEKRIYRLFTFGLLGGKYQIRKREIVFSDSIRFEVRSVREDLLRTAKENLEKNGIWLRGRQYRDVKVELCDDMVKKDGVYIDMDSPICVYSTDRETKHTEFFAPDEERFYEAVSQNFMRKYEAAFGKAPASGITLNQIDVKEKDKYVTNYKGYYISGWKGRYYLSGEPEYLNFLYQTGLGSKNSQGFGMFRVVEEKAAEMRDSKNMTAKQGEENSTGTRPYSDHIFMYPFSYRKLKQGARLSGAQCEETSQDPLADLFSRHGETWEKESLPDTLGEGKGTEEENILLYNEYQYFSPKARKNLFNIPGKEGKTPEENGKGGGAVSRHYRRRGLDGENDAFYVIEGKNETFKLPLRRIRVSLYPEFGIGILSFEMKYYPEKNRNAFEDVLEINQMGRRLFPPYIKKEKEDGKFTGGETAKKLRVEIGGAVAGYTDFMGDAFSFQPGMELIRQILGIGDSEDIELQSVLDDRMFVCCLIRDDEVSKTFSGKNLDQDLERMIEREKERAENAYRFVFVDGKGGASCQSRRMMKEDLQACIYDRWIDYGTFHGVTEYSFVCATGEEEGLDESVINPFLTMYVEMAKLAIAQRSAVVNIENMILDKAVGGDTKQKPQKVEQIRNIWRIYADFQNMLFLPEVTFQQQGVELYRILKEALKIDVMNAHLEKELDHLHDVAELDGQIRERESDDKITHMVNRVTIIGLPIALVSLLSALQDLIFGMASLEKGHTILYTVLIVLCWIVGVPAIIVLWRWLERKTGKNGNKEK